MFNGASSADIQSMLWPIVRDNPGVGKIFCNFVDQYAHNSNDLDEWPILRLFAIWDN